MSVVVPLLVGCATGRAAVAEEPSSPVSVDTNQQSTAGSPSDAEPLLARVQGDKVQIADVAVTSDELEAALERERKGLTTLAVELAAGYDDDALGRLLAAADRAAFKQIELRNNGRIVAISLADSRKKRLLVWNSGGRLRLYDLGAGSAAAATFAAVVIDDAESEQRLRDRLSAICRNSSCHAGIEVVSGDDGEIWRILDAWQRVTASLRGVTAELAVTARARKRATTTSGHLPPSLIQAVVRRNFDVFRVCYEAGLGRDSNLEGRVDTRFVIGRDGKVSGAAAEPSTTLPDAAVVSCVIEAFGKLEFPAPENGIVTVVYPILLAPG